MKKICTLLAVSTLCVASVGAQTVSDDFNDNSRDAALWEDPELDGGVGGKLDEVNSRLEFDAPSAVENFVFQEAKLYPTYNQAWQATTIVSLNKVNFGSGGIGFMVLEAGSNTEGDNYVAVGNGAGFLPGEAGNSQAVVTDGGDSVTEDNLLTFATAVPQAFGVKIAYDPRSRMIHAFYDLDTDQTDGEWTLLKSYTIDGSVAPVGGLSLDWGMSAFDTFRIQLNGGSENVGVSVGNAWFDDFEFVPGSTIPTPTIADDFDDNSRDPLNWQDPTVESPGTNGDLKEQNQRLEFVDDGANDQWITQQVNNYPGYNEPWQVQMLASVAELGLGANQLAAMGIEVQADTAQSGPIEIGFAAGMIPELPLGEGIYAAVGDSTTGEDGLLTIFSSDLPDVVGLRMTYDPNTRLIRTYYDLNPNTTDSEWVLLVTSSIDGSAGAGVTSLNWAMSDGNGFFFNVIGSSEGNPVITTGEAWMDDFEFNRGSTAVPATLAFSDDFNDDSIDSNWGAPQIDLGTPKFNEVRHRTEFTAPGAAGEQEIFRSLGGQFSPQYNQAFEVKLDMHCNPSAVLLADQAAATELTISDAIGNFDINFSVGKIFGLGNGVAINNDAIDPTGEDPDKITSLDLPPNTEVVGVRLLWDPETSVMRCYLDTDDDLTVETWVLYTDYTLNGDTTQGVEFPSDWQMSATDRFGIGINGFSEGVAVTDGEAYFDNFSLINAPQAPVLTGYELWASDILDEGMRGQTVDASGNGLPNLLQYMYGLAPMATDTDVKLSIQMEGGFPVIYHGLNETAPDYFIWYQLKNSLSDPWVFAVGNEATSMEILQINGKTQNKLTFPTSTINNFVRLIILPY